MKHTNKIIGVELHTAADPNCLIDNGYTDAWWITPEKLSGNLLRVWSLSDRGLYFEAKITKVELVSTVGRVKRYRIYFIEAVLQRLSTSGLLFKRNPVHYIRSNAA